MKRSFPLQTRIAAFGAAGLTLLCALFALIIVLTASHPDPQATPSTPLNPLDGAKDGVSMLLRADQSNDEYFAANYFPTLNGAKGDGVSNDTKPLKESLQRAAETGGTVYLPQGIYRITEPLTLSKGVTLRGDFSPPNAKISDGGKTILLVANTKDLQKTPLITLESGAALEGITVYYEEQDPEKIIQYPATVYGTGSVVLRQITLLNPYHGICITGSGRAELRSLWMSPLDYGILVTDNDSTVIIEDCQISPTYWLNYAPSVFSDGKGYPALTRYLHEKMHGILLENVNDVTLNRVFAEDAAVGVLYNVPPQQSGILLTKELTVSSTDRPVYIQSLPQTGICFADSTLRPDNDAGANTVEIAKEANAPVLFSGCTFAGLPKTVIKAENHSFVSFYHCNFGTWWNVCFDMAEDTFLALSPTFKTENEKATLGKNAFGLLYRAPSIEESSKLLFSIPEQDAKTIENTVISSLKEPPRTFANGPVIHAGDYGASPQSEDNSPALQAAFAAAEKEKGTVFLPEGIYKFKSVLSVPESVRFIGVGSENDYRTVLSFELTQNTSAAFVELKENASLEDLEIRQGALPSGSDDVYAVESNASNVRISGVSVTASRAIRFLAGETGVIERLTVNATRQGITLQNVKNLTLRNVTVSDPIASRGAVGITMENAVLTASGLWASNLKTAIELTGSTDLSATLVTLKGTTEGINANHTGKVQITASGFSPSDHGESTVFFSGTETMTGTTTLQGWVLTGTSRIGNLICARAGAVELRAGIISSPYETTVAAEGNGKISVYGCIWNTSPVYHATANGGSVTLEANLLKSEKTFAGIEGNYMLTATGEESGTIEDGINVIQHTYVYVESEDAGQSPSPEKNGIKKREATLRTLKDSFDGYVKLTG
ncbi:MAG: hypothetical protein J6B54_02980 [Clostridia bacterium]|nr:hypothetical protein [Clostridia bacterium]